MNIDDPNDFLHAVTSLCAVEEYFDARYPTPLNYEEYVTAPLLPEMTRYTREEIEAELDRLTAEASLADQRKTWASAGAFWDEFADQEKYTIQVSMDPTVVVLRSNLNLWLAEVWSDDPRIAGALDYLESIGILTAERHAAILAK